MAQRRPRDQRVVRNRRVAIYTFLLILTLFYISAHRTVQKEREMEALGTQSYYALIGKAEVFEV